MISNIQHMSGVELLYFYKQGGEIRGILDLRRMKRCPDEVQTVGFTIDGCTDDHIPLLHITLEKGTEMTLPVSPRTVVAYKSLRGDNDST